KLVPERVRKGAEDSPVLSRFARGKRGSVGHLHAAFCVDVDRRLFWIGSAGQNHVGATCTPITMRPYVDNLRASRYLDLVASEQEKYITPACRHLRRVEPPRAWHETEVQRGDARGRAMQDRETIPTILQCAKLDGRVRRERSDRGAVLARKSAGADQNERPL